MKKIADTKLLSPRISFIRRERLMTLDRHDPAMIVV